MQPGTNILLGNASSSGVAVSRKNLGPTLKQYDCLLSNKPDRCLGREHRRCLWFVRPSGFLGIRAKQVGVVETPGTMGMLSLTCIRAPCQTPGPSGGTTCPRANTHLKGPWARFPAPRGEARPRDGTSHPGDGISCAGGGKFHSRCEVAHPYRCLRNKRPSETCKLKGFGVMDVTKP